MGDLLLSFLRGVVVFEDQTRLMIDPNELRQLVSSRGEANGNKPDDKRKPCVDPICLTIDAKLKKYGGVVHIVVPPNPTNSAASSSKPSLLKALARAHGWYEMALEGKAVDLRALSRHAGMSERYVGKVFECAFLAPDIVESILRGHQPDDLTFAKLAKGIPLSWVEQRRQFGFTQVPAR